MSKGNRNIKLTPLAWMLGGLIVVPTATAQEAYFSESLLRSVLGNQNVDLTFLQSDMDVGPGDYRVEVYVNQKLINTENVRFKAHEDRLEPELTIGFLRDIGIDVDKLEIEGITSDQMILFPLSKYFPDWKVEPDVVAQRLEITVPQAYLNRYIPWDDVAPQSKWDNGIPALVMNYDITGASYHDRNDSGRMNNFYLGLNPQLNIGPWRLRSSATFNYSKYSYGTTQRDSQWDIWNTYLQRDLPWIKSTLKIGDISTAGNIFDSFSMRGVTIESNEQMFPSVDRNFVPVIRGTANSFALVSIRQAGRVVYQTNVAPGPFELNNLPNLGNGGDLEVLIREADGTERVERYPYSSLPEMVKEGQFRYVVNAGRYYSTGQVDREPYFMLATATYGLPWDSTVYGGALISDKYYSGALGLSKSLGDWGAVSVDMTQARVAEDKERNIEELNGAAFRFRYSKNVTTTGTSLNLMNYRYLTGHYRTFNQLNNYGSNISDEIWESRQVKDRWTVSLSQPLGRFGNVSASGSLVTYRDGNADTKSWNIWYSKAIAGVGVNLSYSRNYVKHDGDWEPDHRIMLGLDIPFSLIMGESITPALRDINFGYQGAMEEREDGKHYTQQAYMRGSLLDNRMSWHLTQDIGSEEDRSTALNLSYSGEVFSGNASYSRTHQTNTYQMSFSGGLLVHSGGLTLAPRSYGSIALVEVEDVAGAKVNRSANVHTDYFGYAVVSNLHNYGRNELVIDPASLPSGTLLLDGTNKDVFPTDGAVVKVTFPARKGHQAIFMLNDRQGDFVPFGAQVDVFDQDNQPAGAGIVGQRGRLYLSGIPSKGTLKITWFVSGEPWTTSYEYSLPKKEETTTDTVVSIPTVHLGEQRMGKASSDDLKPNA